ncbi:hypothetical protein LV84_02491 [Algoriphagus ratkowskyi]|uniref:Uncharacterized protein n=1 Tax=Algoriphagus ratkowskyi TaxID=57028 RepID=A0A2W7R3G1_9BACT|nr:DUF6603 domain-containing protein [Algoriphagus ratkowskyi]PZX55353.1 hypothetical protein LV84_02491 [Algoriphagus ratkowskyi]TXD79716.1 hypothetical protein ESW18_00875 [Algoriphagus ratkowskyi]
MATPRLSLVELITPQYLAGIQLPEQLQEYLGIIGIDKIDTFYTSEEVVYTGKASLELPEQGNTTHMNSNNGSDFSWDTPYIHFRMIIPRNGAEFIDSASNDFDSSDPSTAGKLPEVSKLLNDLRPQPDQDMDATDVITDFPAVGFKLELLVDVLNFTLGDDWKPGKIDPNDNRVRIDNSLATDRVKIKLPKVVLEYSQGDLEADLNPKFEVKSWGVAGFDAPQDLKMGELIRMEPPIAVYANELVAFSIDRVILDLSEEATPPEVLEHFGVDEAWKGLYIGQALLFFNNDQGVGFNFRVNDLLVSTNGEVSFEAALDIYLNSTLGILTAEPTFYNGATKVTEIRRGVIFPPVPTRPSGTPAGQVTVLPGAVMHLQIHGGMPTYLTQVLLQDGTDIWDASSRTATFSDLGNQDIFIIVTDSSTGAGSPLRSSEYLRVKVEIEEEAAPPDGLPEDRPEPEDALQALTPFAITGNTDNRSLIMVSNGQNVDLEIRGAGNFTVELNGSRNGAPLTQTFTNQRRISVPAPNGTELDVAVNFPASTAPNIVHEVKFQFARPKDGQQSGYISYASSGNMGEPDPIFLSSVNELLNNHLPTPNLISSINFTGYASKNRQSADADRDLASRRNEVVRAILRSNLPTAISIPLGTPNGQDIPLPYSPVTNPNNRMVRVTIEHSTLDLTELTAKIERPEVPATPDPTLPVEQPEEAPEAPTDPRDIPDVLKQLGIRIKFERNEMSLLELYGKIDFETKLESEIRSESTELITGELREGGNPQDGLVDFKLGYQYNRATKETALSFLLKSDERDTDGIIPPLTNNASNDNLLINIFGALLIFAPIINSAAKNVGENNEDGAAWVGLGASVAVPIVIGSLGIFRTRKIILHGGEARTRWVTPAPGEPLRSLDVGIVFDYEVHFDIIVQPLGIGLDRQPREGHTLPEPLKARYKAIGFNLNYSKTEEYDGLTYEPIFDASKGYDLDLSDPALFAIPEPLNSLFNIAGARLARFNPTTLEVDFVIKVDLGIITVDKFKLKIPIDTDDAPQIIPSGVKVNIPGVIVGNGFVEIIDSKYINDLGVEISTKGVEGGLDLTLVSLKIRIAANVGIGTLKDPISKREAVSVFLGLRVEFPTPIILGATGLGIYGLMGLFAMHYKRLEAEPDPTKAVGPALNWLIKASGDPTKLRTDSAETTAMLPTGNKLWGMAFDRWSFGIGVLLGTVEGGFLVNLQGMLVLELPGPRILIMVKVKMVSVLPSNPADPAKNLEMGIIGIVDIDFGRKQLTLGVMINFSIEEILEISLPIELFFKWDEPSNWHLYLGTIAQPASATILNIVRGSAYLMIQGNQLVYSEFGSRVPEFFRDKTLNGIAIAVGLEASIVFGRESSGIYLKIAAGAHLGVSFAPFLVVGNMYFEGHLRLLIVSISARGEFNILVSKRSGQEGLKTYINGKVCGSIDLWFFEISACIGVEIGDEGYEVEPPKLVRGLYLQSFSPVLNSGQGSIKPIDASLGNGEEITLGAIPSELIKVPIDTLPVIQFHASPRIASTFVGDSFVTDPGTFSGIGGKLQLSEEVEVEYILNKVQLLENGAVYESTSEEKPPSVWRIDRPSNGSTTDTAIDLATFSRTPATAPYAIERSSELNTNVEITWKDACKQAAPPASVFFSFCGQHIGYSQSGWTLDGIAKADPEDTIRVKPVDKTMRVIHDRKAQADLADIFLEGIGFPHSNQAQVIGIDKISISPTSRKEKKCFNTLVKVKDKYESTYTFGKEIKISLLNQGIKPIAPDIKVVANPAGIKLDRIIITKPISGTNTINTPLKDQPKERVTNLKNLATIMDAPIIKRPDLVFPERFIEAKETGIPVDPEIRIHFLNTPVTTALINFEYENTTLIKSTRLTAIAFDTKGIIISEQTFSPKSTKPGKGSITLSGQDISYVQVHASKFHVEVIEVCYEKIIVTQPTEAQLTFPCFRALQLPWFQNQDRELLKRYNKLVKAVENDTKSLLDQEAGVIFETGACDELFILGANFKKGTSFVWMEELSSAGEVLERYQFNSLPVQTLINYSTTLPAHWIMPGAALREKVLYLLSFLSTEDLKNYYKFTLNFKPKNSKMTKLRMFVTGGMSGAPMFLISAIEVLRKSEVQHHADLQIKQDTSRTTLDAFINNDSEIPMLRPGKTYQLIVDYTSIVRTRKNKNEAYVEHSKPGNQVFAFATDNTPPLPLAPYVLGTTPEMDEQFHFFQDPIKVVFNDNAFLKMYDLYGKELQGIIRGADGKPVLNSPEAVEETGSIPAIITSPYRAAVERLIELGFLPCTGVLNIPLHPVYTPSFELKPNMPYTFDIDISPEMPLPESGVKTPFFRRSFKTSRYANLEGMADHIKKGQYYQKALTAQLSATPGGSGPDIPVAILEDSQMESMLRNAGYMPKDAPEETIITLLWVQMGSSGDFVPYGILIDALEPLWRDITISSETNPRNEQNQIIDPNFIIYENHKTKSVELVALPGEDRITKFIRTSSGARTLILLDPTVLWNPDGEELTIQIRQNQIAFYEMTEKTVDLISLPIFPDAPWEES